MTLKELADALECIDEEAFSSMLLEYELDHDDGPRQVKMMIVDALPFGPARDASIEPAAR